MTLTRARQFLAVADDVRALHDADAMLIDACVTLYIRAGMAAGDALCTRHLGRRTQGHSHEEAVHLLKTVDREAARGLSALLGMRTRTDYGHPAAAAHLDRAGSIAAALVDRAAA